jgi:hypothetical protein
MERLRATRREKIMENSLGHAHHKLHKGHYLKTRNLEILDLIHLLQLLGVI